ncbi:MAG: YgaP family membrane protein [Bacteroidales bacterium]
MKTNMNLIDRVVRILIAVVVAVLYFTNILSGTVAIILLILSVVFILTSLIGFCPLYIPLGINTNKKNK